METSDWSRAAAAAGGAAGYISERYETGSHFLPKFLRRKVVMEYIVDVQGFKRSLNKFVFKEVAIVALEEDALPLVITFQPPYSWSYLLDEHKSVNRWLELHWHGIPWSSGDVPYERLVETLEENLRSASKIWVKGLEKKRWLEEVLPTKVICNIEDSGCPSLAALGREEVCCSHHKLSLQPVCALENAHKLKKWYFDCHRRPLFSPYFEGDDEIDCNFSFASFNSAAVSSLSEGIDNDVLHSVYT